MYVLMEPRNEERMADRHAVASCEDERQHDENKTTDIHIGKRGSETAHEEQPDNLRKALRYEQEAPNTESSSTMHVSFVFLTSGENNTEQSHYLCRSQFMLTMTYEFLRWMHFSEIVERKSRYIKEELASYPEDAGDLRGRELNELVGNMTPLNALEGTFWKSEKSNPNIVMNEKFVKNRVMDAKIDPTISD